MSYGMDGWNHDNDLVRRKDVMDSLVKEYNRRFSLGERNGLHLAWIEKAVNDVPFAQPTQNTRVNSNNALDTISRQAAIDAMAKFVPYAIDDDVTRAYTDGLTDAYNLVCQLPSAQPEPLTDKEKRIFLAAMGREEKVCEEVDRNYIREPYEDSLMRVCKEIRRKVKGALWI